MSGYIGFAIDDSDGLPPSSEFRWQWLRNGQPIPGETDELSYIITADDIGSRISIRLQFTDSRGFEEKRVSDATEPIPNGPIIGATHGFYFDDNDATAETLTVDVSGLNYPDMPTNRSYEYKWHYQDANGDISLASPDFSRTQDSTFTLTDADDGKYITVEVFISDADDGDVGWKTKFANRATPEITMRPPVEAPANMAANVPSGGGSVTVMWGLTSLGGGAPTSFEYRYKPTALLATAPFTDTDWIALAGGRTRRVTVPGGLINNAAYTFEVRSKTALVDGVAESVEATYLHETRACP